MDREGAEAYLRQVAETELRRLTGLDDAAAVQWHSGRLALAAQVLRVVGAVDDDIFWEIQGELQLALATRQLSRPALAPLARQHVDMVVRIERARAADRFNRTPAY